MSTDKATPPHPQKLAVSKHGMVSSANSEATEAGVRILEEGGNAIDAAVATAFALGVCEPAASGLGGQTMMLLHLASPRKTFALDGSSRAPNRASVETLSKAQMRRGHKATTVPSTPAVLRYALERYGTMKLPAILDPAIQLAQNGFRVTELFRSLSRRELKQLKAHNGGEVFLKDGEKPYPVGALLPQPALADTLRRIAKKGVREFYTGMIARIIHADMKRNGGILQRDDLAQIPRPIERRPLSGTFRDYRIMTFPPPGAGRTLIEMLNIWTHLPARRRNLDSADGAVLLAEVIRRAFLDRTDRPHDPNYFPQIQEERMTSREYAKLAARQALKRVEQHGETTHLTVMDGRGNVVALTQSIERVFGAFVMAPELGFLYNNYMSAFEYEDLSHPYYMRPNAVPWASVAPTIVFSGKHPYLALGSPGSERITSSIFQVLVRLKTRTPLEAVTAPRLHCSLDGTVSLEASRMRSDIPDALRRRGFKVDRRDPFAFYMGCIQMVLRDGKEFIGIADPRRDGSAGGPSRVEPARPKRK